jgi:hypothetical protein
MTRLVPVGGTISIFSRPMLENIGLVVRIVHAMFQLVGPLTRQGGEVPRDVQ